MSNQLEGRAQGYNKHQVQKAGAGLRGTEDRSRNLKRQIGIIDEVHPERLAIRVRVPLKNGGTRFFGQSPGATAPYIPLSDDPLDILQRFGGVERGMVVEVFWRGLSEGPGASAHLVGATSEEARAINLQPRHTDNTASSLPFKPMGIF
jgi:hypothetical protein